MDQVEGVSDLEGDLAATAWLDQDPSVTTVHNMIFEIGDDHTCEAETRTLLLALRQSQREKRPTFSGTLVGF